VLWHRGDVFPFKSILGHVVTQLLLLLTCRTQLLDGLHGIALKVLDHWRYKMIDALPASKANVDVGFAKGDATNADLWRDATLVFCNATCFSDSVRLPFGRSWCNEGSHLVLDALHQLIQAISAAAGELVASFDELWL
jgi:hypothetical protein